ncbi:MAG: bifunctional hydroxymethylpyrimidine kinase/phosphomethylpyrimidine kinase [Terriglobales bacterium]
MVAHGCYAVASITALTVQSTKGVFRVEGVPAELVIQTLEELASDLEIAAVHIGMLGSAEVAEAVAAFLHSKKLPNIVLDPILRSSSGAELLAAGGLKVLIQKLLPIATVVTPNIAEATDLVGFPVTTLDQMREAANKLHEMGSESVVVTGGHMERAVDLLSFTSRRGIQQEVFRAPRQRSTSTHGTGCAFSSAITCHLAHGRGLPEAVLLAKAYVSAAIAKAYPIGHGTGPINHLYRMHQERRPVSSEFEKAHT